MAGVILFLLSFSFSVSASKCRDQQVVMYTVEGHAFSLFCDTDQHVENETYTWTKDNNTLKATPRIKFQGRLILFLSVVSSDSGDYICRSTNSSVTMERAVFLHVERGPCPHPNEFTVAWQGSNISLSCTEDCILTLGQALQIWWWKDCESTGMQGKEISFFNVPMSVMGKYTCMITFKYEGKTYTAAHTIELTVLKNETEKKPEVISPRDITMHVKPGERMKLDCTAFIGTGEEAMQETTVYWTINDSYTQKYPKVHENLTFERRDDDVYVHSTLFIPEVLPEFFGMLFKCVVLAPSGVDVGVVHLRQDENTIQIIVIISVLIGVAIMGTLLFIFFKVDIILACHDLAGKGKAANQDQKPYDAYVFWHSGNGPGYSWVEDLALRLLPEVLEHQHNLRLFIHGRDDTDAEVNPAAMTDVINQSRTVVLILHSSSPANLENQALIPLSQDQDKLSLCSAIAQCNVPVILVKGEENVDHSLLPESIQDVRPQSVLRLNPRVRPSGRFWKQLRYRMT